MHNEAADIVGDIGKTDFDGGSVDADGGNLQVHSVFLISKGMFHKGSDFGAGSVAAFYCLRHWLAFGFLAMDMTNKATLSQHLFILLRLISAVRPHTDCQRISARTSSLSCAPSWRAPSVILKARINPWALSIMI